MNPAEVVERVPETHGTQGFAHLHGLITERVRDGSSIRRETIAGNLEFSWGDRITKPLNELPMSIPDFIDFHIVNRNLADLLGHDASALLASEHQLGLRHLQTF